MTIAWKNFTLNNPGDVEPWGDTEQTTFKDIIDTLVLDACVATKESPNAGHKHFKVYNTTGATAGITADASANMTFAMSALFAADKWACFGNTLAAPYGRIYWDADGGAAGTGALTIESTATAQDITIKTFSSGSILLEPASGGMVEIKVLGTATSDQRNSSIGFYISGGALKVAYKDDSGTVTTGTIALT